MFRYLLEINVGRVDLQTDERTLLDHELMVAGGCMMGLNMDLCILCKRCLISIQSILLLLYVDPKKYSFFFFFSFGERKRK